ncbi:MAG: hypothetical protein NTW28_07550, partial [Candidatus Solibacter sp.]|nr:hypothetical protein [Candidatus Solibacter sp.]
MKTTRIAWTAALTDGNVCPTLVRRGLRYCGAGAFACQLIVSHMVGGAALAQDTEANTFRGMVRLNRAPVSNEVLKVKLPRPVERPLSNGLRLVVLESHRAPTIALT